MYPSIPGYNMSALTAAIAQGASGTRTQRLAGEPAVAPPAGPRRNGSRSPPESASERARSRTPKAFAGSGARAARPQEYTLRLGGGFLVERNFAKQVEFVERGA